MFILIPLILIFLAIAYLQVTQDITIYTKISVYLFIAFVIFISLYLAKIIKKDLIKQEINNIQLNINKLKQKLINTEDEREQKGFKNEIKILYKELELKKTNLLN